MTDHDKQLCIQLETESSRADNDRNKAYFKRHALAYLHELEGLVDDPSKFMNKVGWMVANLTDEAFRISNIDGQLSGIEFVTGLDEI